MPCNFSICLGMLNTFGICLKHCIRHLKTYSYFRKEFVKIQSVVKHLSPKKSLTFSETPRKFSGKFKHMYFVYLILRMLIYPKKERPKKQTINYNFRL